MNRWHGKTAVVTGAGSGIGSAITKSLIGQQINVVGLDTQAESLENISRGFLNVSNIGQFRGITCDITNSDDLSRAFELVEKEFGGIDIMVNNAGVTNYSRIIDADRQSFERLANTNIIAVAACSNAAVKSMRNRSVEGHIFILNSIVGHEIPMKGLTEATGSNGYNIYPACKHATIAIAHSLRRELSDAKLPIRVTSISPGLVKTAIAKGTALANLFDEMPALEPEDIATGLLYALGTRPEVQVTELTIRRTGEL